MKCLVVSLPQGDEVAAEVAPLVALVETDGDVACRLVSPKGAAVYAKQLSRLDHAVGAVGRDIWLCWYHCTLKMSSSLINPFLSHAWESLKQP